MVAATPLKPFTTPKRMFVPQTFDAADWSHVQPLADQLLERRITSPAELERWLLDFSELSSVVDEYGAKRYIDKSCHTEDAEIEKRFMHFIENIEPRFKPIGDKLQRRFLESPFRAALETQDKRYAMLARQWQADVDIFREANVPIETEVTKLVTEYDKICGAQMVSFRGREYTQQQLARFLEEPDRATREEAWRAGTARRLQDRETIEGLFDQILPLRQTIAKNADLPDYRAFAWKQYKRFDYTPQDCLTFGAAIAKACVPLAKELDDKRAKDLGVDRLRPWDIAVDPMNRAPLKPFDEKNIDDFINKTKIVFDRLSPQLAEEFESLRRNANLDLDSRRGKQPGGYQSTLNECRQPFIFMNAAGLQRDVETLLHEGGHAFHAIASQDEPLVFLRNPPMEFCEVASMAMELLAEDHLDVFYNPTDHARAKRVHLEGIIKFFPWMATIDLFQHWLYEHPKHTRDERKQEWRRLNDIYGRNADWTGLEEANDYWWQRQLHLFHVPFYYVEYGIAQLGALQMWRKAKDDPRQALANYRAGLRLAGTRPLPELFSAAGIHFDFSEKTLTPLMNAVRDELAELPV